MMDEAPVHCGNSLYGMGRWARLGQWSHAKKVCIENQRLCLRMANNGEMPLCLGIAIGMCRLQEWRLGGGREHNGSHLGGWSLPIVEAVDQRTDANVVREHFFKRIAYKLCDFRRRKHPAGHAADTKNGFRPLGLCGCCHNRPLG